MKLRNTSHTTPALVHLVTIRHFYHKFTNYFPANQITQKVATTLL